jgi:hypothetical protein
MVTALPVQVPLPVMLAAQEDSPGTQGGMSVNLRYRLLDVVQAGWAAQAGTVGVAGPDAVTGKGAGFG